MCQSYKKQKGMSGTMMLFLALVFGFAFFCGTRTVPAYYDNILVQDALKSLSESHRDELTSMSKSSVRKFLHTFYNLNGVRAPEVLQALDIDRGRDSTLINVNYEVRVPLFANVDVVMKFNNQLNSAKPEECCKPKVKNVEKKKS